MVVMRWLTMLAAGAVLAQTGPRPRVVRNPFSVIAGRVLDADTGEPIHEARVHIVCREAYGRVEEVTLVTTANGMFNARRMNEEGCAVSVLAEGYVASREDAERGAVKLAPASAGPAPPLRFGLHREAEVSGTVIDRSTEKPVAGLTVWAQWAGFERGKRILRAAADAVTTDAEGRFRLKRLPPGKYFVQVGQREQERIEGRARAEEKIAGYARGYWPDGAHEAAAPLWVYGGARLDAGAVFVERRPLYRAHAVIDVPVCSAGRKYRTVLWQQQGAGYVARASDVVACGAPFTVHNLTPGAWWVEARWEGAAAADADAVLEAVEVRDADVNVELRPLPALRIGLKMAGGGGEAMLVAEGLPGLAGAAERIVNGAAVLTAPAAGRLALHLVGLDEKQAVAGIRYNGGSTEDGVFMVNRSAPSQLVEVELTDKPAALEGEVRAGSLVVLAAWPAALRAEWPRTRRAVAGGDGTFSFPALAAGEYRVFAVDAGLRERLEEPGLLMRLIGNAREVRLGEGERLKTAISAVSPD
jgi:hypothetical protein